MTKKLLMGMGLCTLIFFASCKKDKDEPEFDVSNIENIQVTSPSFEPIDGQKVSNSITIEGSVKKDGVPPAPSTDAAAPKIDDYSDSDDRSRVQSGKAVVISPYVYGSEISGYYVKVQGSDDYFDVEVPNTNNAKTGFKAPAKSTSGNIFKTARTNVNSDQNLVIEIPSSLQTGEFCVDYCVYDSVGRVSNIVTECIQVQSFGGSGASFLTAGRWNFDKVSFVVSATGESTTINKGENDGETYTTSLECTDGSYKDVEIETEFILSDFWIEFAQNGGMQYEYTETGTRLDYSNSTCDNVIYEDDTYTDKESGAWAYDESTQTLTLLIADTYETIDGETIETTDYFVDFRVNQSNNQLILSLEDDFDDSDIAVYYFSK